VKDALLYIPADPLGLDGTGFQGANLWQGKNPDFGATFTLHLKDEYKTLKQIRQEKEKALEKDKKDVVYPSFDEIRKEEQEEKAQLIYVIRDSKGMEMKRLLSSPSKGISKMTWNLRQESTGPIQTGRNNDNNGFLVSAGIYSVEILLVKDAKIEVLVPQTKFTVKALNNQTLVASNPEALQKFRSDVAEMSRKVRGTGKLMSETKDKLDVFQTAILSYPSAEISLIEEIKNLKIAYDLCLVEMYGDRIKSSREFETYPSISDRMGLVEYQIYENTVDVSNTRLKNLQIVQEEYLELRKKLDDIIVRTRKLEEQLDTKGIPYTKGKDESWKED
jgi:hypothetical protein